MNLKKDLAVVGGLFLLVVVLLVFGRGFTTTSFIPQSREATRQAQPSESTAPLSTNKPQLTVKTLKVSIEVADSAQERKKGLSDREGLAFGDGMLFVFEKSSGWTFWMKDMKFPIDIIWIGDNKKIVDIVQNATPEPSKKDEELKRYRPKADALYVLEINAGLSKLNNLEVGDTAEFEL